MTLEAEVSAAPPQAMRVTIPAPLSLEAENAADRTTLIPVRYHGCMAMTLRLPDDLDAKLTERARREGRSKQELAIEAIRDAQNRAELKVDDVLAELMDSDAEILDYLR
nr:ribbon-helix-helix protein, CopG family [Streptomyces sp. CB09001]